MPRGDDITAQVLLLKGLEPNGYLLYSMLNNWQGATLEEMYRKTWRVYTGVVHPYMMQQVAKVPLGSTPMELDAANVLIVYGVYGKGGSYIVWFVTPPC